MGGIMAVLNKGKLGAMMRYMRTDAGYANAEDFAKALTEVAGYKISKETIYKYESGTQEPKLSAFIAAEILCKRAVEDTMLMECLSDDGKAKSLISA